MRTPHVQPHVGWMRGMVAHALSDDPTEDERQTVGYATAHLAKVGVQMRSGMRLEVRWVLEEGGGASGWAYC